MESLSSGESFLAATYRKGFAAFQHIQKKGPKSTNPTEASPIDFNGTSPTISISKGLQDWSLGLEIFAVNEGFLSDYFIAMSTISCAWELAGRAAWLVRDNFMRLLAQMFPCCNTHTNSYTISRPWKQTRTVQPEYREINKNQCTENNC